MVLDKSIKQSYIWHYQISWVAVAFSILNVKKKLSRQLYIPKRTGHIQHPLNLLQIQKGE